MQIRMGGVSADELVNGPVTGIAIAVAYIEDQGVRFIGHLRSETDLPREAVKVFISQEFSRNNPAALLDKLDRIAQVYVLRDDHTSLHAKVVWVKGEPGTVFLGSSNLTHGGFNRNLECNVLFSPDTTQTQELSKLFDRCEILGLPVTEEVKAVYSQMPAADQQTKAAAKKWAKFRDQLDNLSLPAPALEKLVGNLFSENEMAAVTGVGQRHRRLRLSGKKPTYKAALIVTYMKSEGDQVSPPDFLAEDRIYLNAEHPIESGEEIFPLLKKNPKRFRLWVFHRETEGQYRCLGLARVHGQEERAGANRWVLKLVTKDSPS